MTFRQYIAEEIATDHADGLMTRREALRRLALLGLTAAGAASVLAACARDGEPTVATPPAGAGSPAAGASPGAASPVPTEPVTYPGPDGRTLQGAWAPARDAKGAVMVIHENRGLNDHTRSVAGRFAAEGYGTLAPDLLSEEGGTAAFSDPAEASARLGNAPRERLVADLRATIDELARRAGDEKLAVVGFCFGGGLVWELLHAGEPRLAAAVPFYGPAPGSPDFSRSRAAVLGIYAELDARVNRSRDAARAALERAGLTHEIVTYPGADHAFFNDTGQRYDADAARQAYAKVLDWLNRHVASS